MNMAHAAKQVSRVSWQRAAERTPSTEPSSSACGQLREAQCRLSPTAATGREHGGDSGFDRLDFWDVTLMV